MASSQRDYDSADEALAAREALSTALESEALTAPVRLWRAHRPARGGGSPIWEPAPRPCRAWPATGHSRPSPPWCWPTGLYGDATKADEIVARNRVIRNPVAVPGGVDLEVLADA